MISDNASTYFSAAEELTELFQSQLIKRDTQQTRRKLAVHSETSTVAQRVLGEIDRPHQDYAEEGTWMSNR